MGGNAASCSESCRIRGYEPSSLLAPPTRALTSPFCFATQDYPDYYRVIHSPIALSHMRKRISAHQYKTVTQFRDDARLMFSNARTYNQEGSWVYIDAIEMERVFNNVFQRAVIGSGLPGADAVVPAPSPPGVARGAPEAAGAGAGAAAGGMDEALTPMDEDERPVLPKLKSGRKQIVSDDEYLTPSNDD